MKVFVSLQEMKEKMGKNASSYPLLTGEHGCVAGCKSGVTVCVNKEYGNPGIHDDQEGFYVISGQGYAKVGLEEFKLYPGVSFLAAVGVPHAMKCDKDCDLLEVFWFHSKA